MSRERMQERKSCENSCAASGAINTDIDYDNLDLHKIRPTVTGRIVCDPSPAKRSVRRRAELHLFRYGRQGSALSSPDGQTGRSAGGIFPDRTRGNLLWGI